VNNSYSHSSTDVPNGLAKVMGARAPWNNVEGVKCNNPMYFAKNFKTPALITHGDIDCRVPYGNGLELSGVVQAMNDPSPLVVFPNENHGYSRRSIQFNSITNPGIG
jgi:dipeptidyl aminopeptidase/acylaminoacyl peptidase